MRDPSAHRWCVGIGLPLIRALTARVAIAAVFVSGFLGIAAHAAPVFVSSEPFGASVAVNGVIQFQPTPVLLDLPAGAHRLTMERDGYVTVTVEVEVEHGVPVPVHRSLAARYLLIDIPEELPRADRVLPFGTYDVGRQGRVRIAPVFPDERRLSVAIALIPATLASAAALSVWSLLVPSTRPEFAIVPSLTAQAAAAGAIAYASVLLVRRHRYLVSWTPPARPHRPVTAATALSAARELLERGDIPGAIAGFQAFVDDFPDARGVPEALYTLGLLAGVDDRSDDARGYYGRIVDDYPVAEYYDRALLQLARLAARDGDRDATDLYLDMVTFVHPDVTLDAVGLLRSQIGR